MSYLIRFHYDPFTNFDRLFDDAFNAPSIRASYATTSPTQHLNSFRPR